MKIAEELRSKVYEETGLTCSAGVAPNRLLAKVLLCFLCIIENSWMDSEHKTLNIIIYASVHLAVNNSSEENCFHIF